MQFVTGYFNVIDFKCRDMIYRHAIKGKSFIIHDIIITCTCIRLKLAMIDGHLNKSSLIHWLLNVCQFKLHGIQITVKCSNPFSIEVLSNKSYADDGPTSTWKPKYEHNYCCFWAQKPKRRRSSDETSVNFREK